MPDPQPFYDELVAKIVMERGSIEYQLCPVCRGAGIVPQGFYVTVPGCFHSGTSTAPDTCRRCEGTGTILPFVLPQADVSATDPRRSRTTQLTRDHSPHRTDAGEPKETQHG